ncbi:hypothetical protein SeMB42_g00124 [Synchytrium endobioticum]|uniref:Structural maintenance of chromosomes protein n=1 Tax=Synchytrium endobioticum TaxID=286115 RepID=A0A507DK16_9FUNG|nr:hypothetical protein SeLEV6574_g00218 [Synchytrium endobioticum]TPX54904.1 hypothetical protein SeMB42_g00124 [Synchytrium endobioticum]
MAAEHTDNGSQEDAPEAGRLVQIELKDFKSYRGHQVIGPFYNFMAIVGPNGSGKSNLMDAISFVLGVKSNQLRSAQLKELIYKGTRLANEPGDGNHDDHADQASAHTKGKKPKKPPTKARARKRRRDQDDHSDDDDDEAEEEEEDDDDADKENANNPSRAWVTAVIRTSKGREIRFTRTVTAAGSSEYKINKKTVTFSKYNDALKDENILVKARNFLVFQGDVEAIAAQSPKDLTRMIEQISGSLELKAEYDRLKEIQEKATEASTLNFNRKRGINAEMKQVKEQKAEVDRFEKLQRDRAKATVLYLTWKLYHLDQTVNELQAEIAEERGGFANLNQQLAALDAALKETKKEQGKTNRDVMKYEKHIKDKTKEIDSRKPDTMKLEERLSHSTRKLKTAQDTKSKTELELDKQTQEIRDVEEQLQRLQNEFDRFESEKRKQSKSRSGVVLTDNDLAEYNQKKAELNGLIADEMQRLKVVQRGLTTEVETKNRLEEKCRLSEAKIASSLKDQENLIRNQDKIDASLADAVVSRDAAQQELNTMKAEVDRLTIKENELNEKIFEISNRLSQARSDRHASEREAKLKECLETLKKTFPGVHGRLYDLSKPTQNKYNLAVAIVMGKNMDAVVVDDQRTALECIQYLKEQRAGKVTFLPMDSLTVKPINEKYRELHKNARLAIDVIQFNAEYERAVQFACNNAIVCDHMDVARNICYDRNVEVKAVVLDGTIIHKNANITGGATNQTGNQARRWDEKELDNLRQAREKHTSEMEDVVKALRKARMDQPVRAQLAAAQAKHTSLSDERSTIDRQLNSIEVQLKHHRDLLERLKPDVTKSNNTVGQLESLRTDLERHIHEVQDEVFAEFCRRIQVSNIREYEAHETRLGQEYERKKLEHTRRKAQLDNEIKHRKSALNEITDRIAKLEETIQADTRTLEELQDQKAVSLAEEARLASEIKEIKNKLAAVKAKNDEKTAELNRIKKEISQKNKEIETRSKGVTQKETQVEQLLADTFSILRRCKLEEIDLPLEEGSLDDVPLDATVQATDDDDEMDVDEQSNARHPWRDKIAIDYSGLKRDHKQDYSDDMDARLQDSIRDIAAEIERIMPNTRAAENLAKVQEKLNATAAEFDDARKQAAAANKEFSMVKKQRYERFHEAFTHISESIDAIYKELTKSKTFPTGGTAYLALEDGEEPYNDGVKYHAMPPMKRFRDMDQLSGGEKTVAALALLLAVHSYKPAPFFVLDEVDAALDNANVARVANYIRTHASNDFQFIVISLKNTFYEKAQGLITLSSGDLVIVTCF